MVAAAYGGAAPVFGPDYIIPKPFDPRLILEIAPAVARAAMESGVARRPIADFDAYRRELERVRLPLRPADAAGVRGRARTRPSASSIAEGEDERVLRAAQTLVDDGIARADPARPPRGDRGARSARWACAWTSAATSTVLDPAQDDDVFGPWCRTTSGWWAGAASPPAIGAQRRLGNRTSVAAAMLLHAGLADAAICGGTGDWWRQMQYMLPIIPRRAGRQPRLRRSSCLILPHGALFICDT